MEMELQLFREFFFSEQGKSSFILFFFWPNNRKKTYLLQTVQFPAVDVVGVNFFEQASQKGFPETLKYEPDRDLLQS